MRLGRVWGKAALVLLLGFAGTVHAGEGSPKTLFSEHKWDQGGMGALVLGITPFDGHTYVCAGVRGQWIIDHRVGLGLMTYDLHSVRDYPHGDVAYRTKLEMTGLDLEYYFRPENLVHASVNLMIGGGWINMETDDYWEPLPGDSSGNDPYVYVYHPPRRDGFVVLQPGAGLEVNVTKWMRVGGMVSYRFANGVSLFDLHNSDLTGYMAALQVKFGSF